MSWSITGKYVVVSGANSGIGYETTKALYGLGAKVIMICRNRARGEEALGRIREEEAARAGTELHLVLGDMAERSGVSAAAEAISSITSRVDVLLNNAGALFPTRRENSEGLEYTFALNHMGYFRLTASLLPLLQAAEGARIINTASEAHRFTGIDWADPFFERRRYRGFRAYAQSKLMNILFTTELSRRLKGSRITVNALHPGFVRTRFAETPPGEGGSRGFSLMAKIFAIPPEEGAKTSVFLVASPEVEGTTGQYFARSRPKTPTRAGRSAEDARRLWEFSEQYA